MKKYKAILFHPEGDFVTDFRDMPKDQIWSSIADMGSKWFFYPLAFIATDKTIIDTLPGLEHLKGKRISSVKKYFAQNWINNKDEICEVINEGLPLTWIYN